MRFFNKRKNSLRRYLELGEEADKLIEELADAKQGHYESSGLYKRLRVIRYERMRMEVEALDDKAA